MHNERGMAPSVEATILIPALAMIVGLIVVLAHVALAQQEVQAAAAAAARAASVERSTSTGRAAALDVISRSDTCAQPSAAIDVSGITKMPGVDGEVRVSLQCTVKFDQVGFASFPGSVTVTVDASSPVDRYRSR